jgi:hypothetical protein
MRLWNTLVTKYWGGWDDDGESVDTLIKYVMEMDLQDHQDVSDMLNPANQDGYRGGEGGEGGSQCVNNQSWMNQVTSAVTSAVSASVESQINQVFEFNLIHLQLTALMNRKFDELNHNMRLAMDGSRGRISSSQHSNQRPGNQLSITRFTEFEAPPPQVPQDIEAPPRQVPQDIEAPPPQVPQDIEAPPPQVPQDIEAPPPQGSQPETVETPEPETQSPQPPQPEPQPETQSPQPPQPEPQPETQSPQPPQPEPQPASRPNGRAKLIAFTSSWVEVVEQWNVSGNASLGLGPMKEWLPAFYKQEKVVCICV